MNEVKKISHKVNAELNRTSNPRLHVVLYPTALLEDRIAALGVCMYILASFPDCLQGWESGWVMQSSVTNLSG